MQCIHVSESGSRCFDVYQVYQVGLPHGRVFVSVRVALLLLGHKLSDVRSVAIKMKRYTLVSDLTMQLRVTCDSERCFLTDNMKVPQFRNLMRYHISH